MGGLRNININLVSVIVLLSYSFNIHPDSHWSEWKVTHKKPKETTYETPYETPYETTYKTPYETPYETLQENT